MNINQKINNVSNYNVDGEKENSIIKMCEKTSQLSSAEVYCVSVMNKVLWNGDQQTRYVYFTFTKASQKGQSRRSCFHSSLRAAYVERGRTRKWISAIVSMNGVWLSNQVHSP